METEAGKSLTIETQESNQAVVVKVAGSADMGQAEYFREQLEALAARRFAVIVLDLSGMDFISSMGLGAIISAHLKCRHHDGHIRVVNPTAPVRKILEATRLTNLFGIFDTVEDALNA